MRHLLALLVENDFTARINIDLYSHTGRCSDWPRAGCQRSAGCDV